MKGLNIQGQEERICELEKKLEGLSNVVKELLGYVEVLLVAQRGPVQKGNNGSKSENNVHTSSWQTKNNELDIE